MALELARSLTSLRVLETTFTSRVSSCRRTSQKRPKKPGWVLASISDSKMVMTTAIILWPVSRMIMSNMPLSISSHSTIFLMATRAFVHASGAEQKEAMIENTTSYKIQPAKWPLTQCLYAYTSITTFKIASAARTSITSKHLLTHLICAKSSMISCDSSCYFLCKCSPLSCGIDLVTSCAASILLNSASFDRQAGQSTTPSALSKTVCFRKLECSPVIVST